MARRKDGDLAGVIDRFFDLYQPTINLAEDLIAKKRNPQETLLLLCARLDAAASCISSEDRSNRDAFTSLVTSYGGHRDLMQSVSIPDLYYELGYHRWMMDGMLSTPGRLVRYSRLSDPMIDLLDLSGIPLTSTDAKRLLTRLINIIEKRFRCRPLQPHRKQSIVRQGEILAALEGDLEKSKLVEVEALKRAVQPMIRFVTVSDLLYRKFRSEAVHGSKSELTNSDFSVSGVLIGNTCTPSITEDLC